LVAANCKVVAGQINFHVRLRVSFPESETMVALDAYFARTSGLLYSNSSRESKQTGDTSPALTVAREFLSRDVQVLARIMTRVFLPEEPQCMLPGAALSH
jgi:hypothetical protein